jgi:hypothetical protein
MTLQKKDKGRTSAIAKAIEDIAEQEKAPR